MLYFKVVYDKEGTLLSATTRDFEAYIVTYKLNKWTKPNNPQSKLFIFDSSDNAHFYFNHFMFSPKYSIYKCEAKKVEPAPAHLPGVFNEFDAYWNKQQMNWTCDPPQGTLLAQSVKLIELVK